MASTAESRKQAMRPAVKANSRLLRRNRQLAREKWGLGPRHPLLDQLMALSEEFGLSVSAGDVILLEGKWYVTHSGLLRLARRNRCSGMRVRLVPELSNPTAHRFAFEATVFKSKACQGFVGFGDADPSNVSALVQGAELRVAETRAVNRALRKAYGIGLCSVEEIGSSSEPSASFSSGEGSGAAWVEGKKRPSRPVNGNGNGQGNAAYGTPKVRDRLCQLIRQHQLDATLVKAYAIDFCGTKTLREASREQVENFVAHLADWAGKDRNALVCQLNSYLGQEKAEGAA